MEATVKGMNTLNQGINLASSSVSNSAYESSLAQITPITSGGQHFNNDQYIGQHLSSYNTEFNVAGQSGLHGYSGANGQMNKYALGYQNQYMMPMHTNVPAYQKNNIPNYYYGMRDTTDNKLNAQMTGGWKYKSMPVSEYNIYIGRDGDNTDGQPAVHSNDLIQYDNSGQSQSYNPVEIVGKPNRESESSQILDELLGSSEKSFATNEHMQPEHHSNSIMKIKSGTIHII